MSDRISEALAVASLHAEMCSAAANVAYWLRGNDRVYHIERAIRAFE